ncbi:DUF998 domain-containing protein [Lentzea sp. NPDC051838]|uniref:DUF998 domain-containing protein n=1 Tax=Lentzea sp. NPDC051838 TaxID=3154849 RepID=UPI0034441D51
MGNTPVAAALGGLSFVTLVLLHLLPGAGGVDPVNQLLSEYPVRSHLVGVPYVLALLSANAAAALAGNFMMRAGLLRGRLPVSLFVVSLVSLLGLTVFLKDPMGARTTWYGIVHQVCTVLTCTSQLALACVLWWRHRTDPLRRAWAHTIGAFAVIVAVMLIPFVIAFTTRSGTDRFAGLAIGLVERSMFVTLAGMTVVLVLWARTFTGSPRQAD